MGWGGDWVVEGGGVVFWVCCGLVVFGGCFGGVGREGWGGWGLLESVRDWIWFVWD